MTAMVVVTDRSITELVHDANQLHSQIEASTARAEELSVQLGLVLKEAKERKPKKVTWPVFVKEHFDFSRERADELIRIAKGNTTVTKVRANTAARMQKRRARKPVSRDTGSNVVAFKPGDTEAITKKVGAFHHELTNLLDDYCERLEAFLEANPTLNDECRGCLMQALELNSERLQKLAQHIDGR
jgi:hypothetical protein